jgi:hypothetical protein
MIRRIVRAARVRGLQLCRPAPGKTRLSDAGLSDCLRFHSPRSSPPLLQTLIIDAPGGRMREPLPH